jgi:hypothetical protein
VHLRTTDVIKSPFATLRLRQRVTKGAGARQKALLMAFKLLMMTQDRWRCINAVHLVGAFASTLSTYPACAADVSSKSNILLAVVGNMG